MYSLPTTTFDLHPSATRNRSNPPPAPSRFAPPKKRVFPRNNPPSLTGASVDLDSSNVVRNFYDGINRRDLAFVHDLISINCIYEDLIFSRPFVGREAILNFFKQFTGYISPDLQFAIDDISEGDPCAVGVTWHLEWKGKSFPFSRGCSFYRLDIVNGQRQIIGIDVGTLWEQLWKRQRGARHQAWKDSIDCNQRRCMGAAEVSLPGRLVVVAVHK